MRLYEVIYNVLEDVNNALVGMLKPEFEEVVTGEAEVREVFGVPACRQGRRLLRHERRHHPWLEGAVPARRHGHLEGRDRVAAALQGRRARGPRGLRVRYRPRELPGPQAGRRHRDLRGARDRPGLTVSVASPRDRESQARATMVTCTRPRLFRSPRPGESIAEDEARRDPPDRRRAAAPVPASRSPRSTTRTSGSAPRSGSRWSAAASSQVREVLGVGRAVRRRGAPTSSCSTSRPRWLESERVSRAPREVPAHRAGQRGDARGARRRARAHVATRGSSSSRSPVSTSAATSRTRRSTTRRSRRDRGRRTATTSPTTRPTRCTRPAPHLRGVVGRQMRIRQVPQLDVRGRSRHRRRAAHRRDPARHPPRRSRRATRLDRGDDAGGIVSGPTTSTSTTALARARPTRSCAAPQVALACHVSPDGDALGSMLALHHVLRAAGIESRRVVLRAVRRRAALPRAARPRSADAARSVPDASPR